MCGPLLAIVFYLIAPGDVLVDSANPLDPVEAATALDSNCVLTGPHVSGMALALFGMLVVQRQWVTTDLGFALCLLGFFFPSSASRGRSSSRAEPRSCGRDELGRDCAYIPGELGYATDGGVLLRGGISGIQSRPGLTERR